MVLWNTELIPPPHMAQRVGALIWDGNDIVTRGMFAENLVKMAAEDKSNRLKMIILANIAGMSLILALFLWRYYRHLKRKD